MWKYTTESQHVYTVLEEPPHVTGVTVQLSAVHVPLSRFWTYGSNQSEPIKQAMIVMQLEIEHKIVLTTQNDPILQNKKNYKFLIYNFQSLKKESFDFIIIHHIRDDSLEWNFYEALFLLLRVDLKHDSILYYLKYPISCHF